MWLCSGVGHSRGEFYGQLMMRRHVLSLFLREHKRNLVPFGDDFAKSLASSVGRGSGVEWSWSRVLLMVHKAGYI